MELTIEKLIYGGDGLGRLPADEKGRGKAAFVPFTLPGEKVDIALREQKPGFVRAAATRIVEASPLRIEARCPYFQRCGGCHYQHADYREQLRIKEDILKENLRRLAKMELPSALKVHASPQWNYRNRTRLQVRVDSAFALGYFKASSHELLPVESCPISSPLLNRAIETLWRLGRDGQVPQEVREVELFANEDDSLLQVELYVDLRETGGKKQAPQALAERLRVELPEVVSVCIFAQTAASARGVQGHITEEPLWTLGPGEFRYVTKAGALRVSGGSFFQVNRFLVDELVGIVAGARTGEIALDLYAGVGLFSMALAPSFRHIVAVESSQGSAADLKYNSPRNAKAVRSTVDAYLADRGAKLRPDLVVVDPPRAGLGDRVVRSLAQMGAPRLTYVSCDPATLARDLVTLTGAGYRVEQAHLVDLFPQTYHIESVVELVR
ncbi:MAG TPA: 23S rRNA (uracil(1939)-C(5))-methyltransferase RlmD [Terriglobales bacterium]|nr:23S rRNA (uracil(1939)-C(5))-methyltransferase RlmD [Terriglobales bacterium]